jgi:hypothetical protein
MFLWSRSRASVIACGVMLSACAAVDGEGDAGDAVVDGLESELASRAGPPVALSLAWDGDVAHGWARAVVRGAPPGHQVVLATSRAGPGAGPCPAPLSGACLGMLRGSVAGVAQAGADGTAVFSLALPGSQVQVGFQAALISGTPGLSPVIMMSPRRDRDGDGLADDEERALGTSVRDPDSDGDGATDGTEVAWGLPPLDPDEDRDGQPDGADLAPHVPDAPDAWVADDVVVSDPAQDLSDPEYDPARHRFVWQDDDGAALWIGGVDPTTGAFVPPDGRGGLVDVDPGPMRVASNGPEWAISAGGAEIAYIKDEGGRWALWVAREAAPGVWAPEVMPGPTWAALPYGQRVPTATASRVTFRTSGWLGRLSGWRSTADAADVHVLPPELGCKDMRFATDDERYLLGTTSVDGVVQIWQADITTGAWSVITTDAGDKGDPWRIAVPEWGGEPAIVAERGRLDHYSELAIYREIGGAWTLDHTVRAPAHTPELISPEVFTWGDTSWVSFVAATWADAPANGDADVYVVSLASPSALPRRVSAAVPAVRKDAEPYVGGVRPWVFYAAPTAAGVTVIRRVELGIAP